MSDLRFLSETVTHRNPLWVSQSAEKTKCCERPLLGRALALFCGILALPGLEQVLAGHLVGGLK